MLAFTLGSLMYFGAPASAETPPVTQSFRDEHVEIKEHLAHMEQMLADVQAGKDTAGSMHRLVAAMRGHIAPHAAWEEEVLYPVVDRQAGGGSPVCTASMRHEHRIIERWIDELDAISNSTQLDQGAFVEQGHRLLGLILAHFEVEEEVLLPVLDATMTPEQFQSEVMSRAHQH